MPRQTQLFEGPNAVPVQVELVPLQTMACRNWMGVMIVVPALAKADKGDPEVVRGKVSRGKSSRSPGVSAGIDQPSAVQDNHGPEKHSPKNEWKPSDGEQKYSHNDDRNVMIFRDPNVEFRLRQIRNVPRQRLRVLMKALAHQNPTHVRPPLSIHG